MLPPPLPPPPPPPSPSTVARRHQKEDVRRRRPRLLFDPTADYRASVRRVVFADTGLNVVHGTIVTNGRPSIRGREAYEEAGQKSECLVAAALVLLITACAPFFPPFPFLIFSPVFLCRLFDRLC